MDGANGAGGTTKAVVDGTHRSVPPGETLARITPHLPRFGITRVANVTGLDILGIPITVVTRPNSRSLSISQGKGVTLDAAKVSGIMESVEQWHAENIELPLRLASYRELRRDITSGPPVPVDVSRLPGFVRPFNPDERILWIEAKELGSNARRMVPYEMVHLDLRLPLPQGSGFFLAGSNGLASGNDLAEAVVHGICEVIERDALTLFYREPAERQHPRRVDLASVDDPLCVALIERFARAEVDLAVWDLTRDTGVATFLALASERQWNPFRVVGEARGSGTHPDRATALSRALTEVAQSRLMRVVGSRDTLEETHLEAARSETQAQRARVHLEGQPGPIRFAAETGQRFATLEEDLAFLQRQLDAAGLPEVLVVDLSRPEMPVRVARIVVPGLEAFCEMPGYVPGRRAQAMAAAGGA